MLRASKAPAWSLFVLWLLCCGTVSAQRPSAEAIASAHPLATEAGLLVLQAGGNAFDAAVAVSAALAVVEPYGSGLGGGGFWLLHRARDGRQVMIDGRERAPLAAHRDMYLDAQGDVIPRASIDGPLAAGIPGVPAALAHIARHYGRLPLDVSLGPAIILARDGFPVDAVYRRMADFRLQALRRSLAASAQFLVAGEPPPLGHLLKQPDLADTLAAIARAGARAFYSGDIARRMVADVRAHGGIWTNEDLLQYRVVERAPVVARYRGHRIVSAALPSSGGVVLTQIMNMLEAHPLEGLDATDRVHLLSEVMRRAYADRARYLGDSDYVRVPLSRLLSRVHARQSASDIDPDQATPSTAVGEPRVEGRDTTHFSILDHEGNRVAATLSVNYPFGACFVAAGTGVLLNDEMDDFSAKPGVANAYGLVGSQANAIEPGKRMLSSMSPTFVEGPDRITILGTPGGSRIITMVLLGLLDAIDGRPVGDIVARGRFHHQFLPDRIEVEPAALSAEVLAELQFKGHQVRLLDDPYGNMQAIGWDLRSGQVSAASDPRAIGASAVVSPSARHTQRQPSAQPVSDPAAAVSR
ncbi:MAG: gamma-glutamyltransferase [Chromatiaceae bacterium]|nr:gamma-glutamyltransferase [Chromatiaceae bacterium]